MNIKDLKKLIIELTKNLNKLAENTENCENIKNKIQSQLSDIQRIILIETENYYNNKNSKLIEEMNSINLYIKEKGYSNFDINKAIENINLNLSKIINKNCFYFKNYEKYKNKILNLIESYKKINEIIDFYLKKNKKKIGKHLFSVILSLGMVFKIFNHNKNINPNQNLNQKTIEYSNSKTIPKNTIINKNIITNKYTVNNNNNKIHTRTKNKENETEEIIKKIKEEIKKPLFTTKYNNENKDFFNNPNNSIYNNNNKLETNRAINYNSNINNADNYLKSEINPKFNSKQIKVFKEFFEEYYLKDKKGFRNNYFNDLNETNVLKDNILNVGRINPKLGMILKELSKKENVSFKLVIFMTLVESTFGKDNRSRANAVGPLQALHSTMKTNCPKEYKYFIKKYGSLKGQEKFYSDLYIRLLGGIREIKSIARQYDIDVRYGQEYFNIYDLIVIASSYNIGRGRIWRHPEVLLKNYENEIHTVKIIFLYLNVEKIKINSFVYYTSRFNYNRIN